MNTILHNLQPDETEHAPDTVIANFGANPGSPEYVRASTYSPERHNRCRVKENKLTLEIQSETATYETAAKQAGWRKVPHCQYVMRANDGKLYCGYHYTEARSEMLEKLDPRLFDDIGMDEGPDSQLWKGNLVKECSVKECPSFWHKLTNRLGSATD